MVGCFGRRVLVGLVAGTALAVHSIGSLAAQLGQLPPGTLKRQVLDDVGGELARDLLVDAVPRTGPGR